MQITKHSSPASANKRMIHFEVWLDLPEQFYLEFSNDLVVVQVRDMLWPIQWCHQSSSFTRYIPSTNFNILSKLEVRRVYTPLPTRILYWKVHARRFKVKYWNELKSMWIYSELTFLILIFSWFSSS